VPADPGIAIHCPKWGNEMARGGNSLSRAYSRKGAMMECGRCGEITQRRFALNPFVPERVESITRGGTV
jgi:hypothetical protein